MVSLHVCYGARSPATPDNFRINKDDLPLGKPFQWKPSYTCEELKIIDSYNLDEFHCTDCRATNKDLALNFKEKKLEEHRSLEKHKYYEVEDITDHRTQGNKNDLHLRFRIKWKGYADQTWQPEWDLDGCQTKLTKYCESKKIDPPIEYDLVGNSNTDRGFNLNNWTNLDTIAGLWRNTRKSYFRT